MASYISHEIRDQSRRRGWQSQRNLRPGYGKRLSARASEAMAHGIRRRAAERHQHLTLM
jgi:hypothetical protein